MFRCTCTRTHSLKSTLCFILLLLSPPPPCPSFPLLQTEGGCCQTLPLSPKSLPGARHPFPAHRYHSFSQEFQPFFIHFHNGSLFISKNIGIVLLVSNYESIIRSLTNVKIKISQTFYGFESMIYFSQNFSFFCFFIFCNLKLSTNGFANKMSALNERW